MSIPQEVVGKLLQSLIMFVVAFLPLACCWCMSSMKCVTRIFVILVRWKIMGKSYEIFFGQDRKPSRTSVVVQENLGGNCRIAHSEHGKEGVRHFNGEKDANGKSKGIRLSSHASTNFL